MRFEICGFITAQTSYVIISFRIVCLCTIDYFCFCPHADQTHLMFGPQLMFGCNGIDLGAVH